MTEINKPSLKVFLCHASSDKDAVRILHQRLIDDGIDAWLDDRKLLPGQKWRMEISKAVKNADVVIICLSKNSITKEGYVQSEINFALDVAYEKPEDTIFLIPAKFEDCDVPNRLADWQWVNLFSNRESLDEIGYSKLQRSLSIRAENIGAAIPRLSNKRAQKAQILEFADLILDIQTRQALRGN